MRHRDGGETLTHGGLSYRQSGFRVAPGDEAVYSTADQRTNDGRDNVDREEAVARPGYSNLTPTKKIGH